MDIAARPGEHHGTPFVPWRVDVLGPLQLAVEGQERSFPTGRPGRLLTTLLLARGRVVSGTALVEAVWADDPPADPRAALHTTVRRARRALGPAAARLVRQGHGYLLERDGLVVDADALVAAAARADDSTVEQLDHALASWRGDPWDELADDLAVAEAAQLRECRRRLREARARALSRTGRGAQALADLAALVAEDPLAEGPVALLVECLDRQGDVAAALAAYDDYRRRLAETLGLDPSPPARPAATRPPPRAPGRTGPGATSCPRTSGAPAQALREGGAAPVGRARAGRRALRHGGGTGRRRQDEPRRPRRGDHPDDVCWVDLTRVAPGDDVVPAVAEALGDVVADGTSLRAATVQALAASRVLLVLDSCEHTAAAVADLVDTVLRAAPGVSVLATSRERLDVDGEQVLPLPPLQLPALDGPDETALRSSPAVAMFLDRAAAAAPDAVGPEELRVVAEIVWRLDGLPLAIGLAAGRAGALTLTDLRDRLLDHLEELRTASRRAHPRQRTLVATIAWSYDLLSAEEQDVFSGLSVFASGFELDDVEAVLGRAAVPVVADLVQRSLVSPVSLAEGTGTSRFALLETLRAFARDRLDDGRRAAVEWAHGRWAADLARRIDAGIASAAEVQWAETARRRLPDLAAAHRRALASSDRTVAGVVAYGLHRWAYYRVRPDVLAWATPLVGDDDAGALATAAAHAWMTGRSEEALPLARRAVEVGRRTGDLAVAGRGAGILGDLLLGTGDLEQARDAYLESHRLAEAVGDDFDALAALAGKLLALGWLGHPWQEVAALAEETRQRVASPSARSMATYCLGEAWAAADPRRALELMAEAVAEAEAAGSRLVVGVARTAATALAARSGPLDDATGEQLAATLEGWVGAGNENLLLTSLRNTVPVLVRLDRHVAAAELLGALQHRDGSWGEEASALESARSTVRATLARPVFEAAQRAGAQRSLREAAEHAQRSLLSYSAPPEPVSRSAGARQRSGRDPPGHGRSVVANGPAQGPCPQEPTMSTLIDPTQVPVAAGTVSTAIFATSLLPMLWRAGRTRDLAPTAPDTSSSATRAMPCTRST